MLEDATRTVESRYRFVPDLWRLGVILLLTFAVRTWVVSHAVVTSRDSLGFIRSALQFEEPPMHPAHPTRRMTRLEVVTEAVHPPGYYLTVLLVSYPVRALMGGTGCDSMVLSTQVASVLAALLLTFPMYFLGRKLFDRSTAFVATMLFQTLPVWSAITSDGLSDGLFLLIAVTTLWLGAGAFRDPAWRRFLWTGVGCGFAYLVRPEGMLLLAACGLVGAGCVAVRRWECGPGLARMTGLAAGALSIALPYVVLIGKLTNKPTPGYITQTLMGHDAKPGYEPGAARPAPGPLFADWFTNAHNPGESRLVWGLKRVPQEILKTMHYVLPFLSILGVYVVRRQIGHDSATMYLLIQMGIYMAALFALAAMAGYISERHTLLISLLWCYFAAAALPKCGEWLAQFGILGRRFSPQFMAAGLAVALIFSALPSDFRRLHSNRAGHKAAGFWLAEHAQPAEEIFDVFGWAEYYSGRTMQQVPERYNWWEQPKDHPVYTILEPRDPHSRLTYILEAKKIASLGREVYYWPEGNPDKASVIVYRWDPRGK